MSLKNSTTLFFMVLKQLMKTKGLIKSATNNKLVS